MEFLRNTSRILVGKKQMKPDILTRTMGSVSGESLIYHGILKEYFQEFWSEKSRCKQIYILTRTMCSVSGESLV